MVSMSALHSLTAELHGGMLTLAFACIMIVAACQIAVRLRSRMPKRLVNVAIRIRGYAEAAGYVSAMAGVIGLILSAATGMYAWPSSALIDSPEVRNKIMLTLFATVLWAMVVFIRVRFGRGLWTCPAMATLFVVLTIVSFGVVGMTGSLGAHLTVGESLLDPLWNLVGLDIGKDMTLQPSIAAVLALLAAVGLIVSLLVAKRKDLFSVKLGPETCQKFFKWDEPVIQQPTESKS